MHQEQESFALHSLQGGVGFTQIRDACVTVGCRPRRVQLGRDHAGVFGSLDFIGRKVVGEVQGHQRVERRVTRQRGWRRRENALSVRHRLCGSRDRGAQIGHDDRTAKLRCGVRHHGFQRLTIAHMQVPIVRSCQGKGRKVA